MLHDRWGGVTDHSAGTADGGRDAEGQFWALVAGGEPPSGQFLALDRGRDRRAVVKMGLSRLATLR